MYAFIAAVVMVAVGQVSANSSPTGERYPSKAADGSTAAPAAQAGLAGQIAVGPDTPEPTLSADASQHPAAPGNPSGAEQNPAPASAPSQPAPDAAPGDRPIQSPSTLPEQPAVLQAPKTSDLIRAWSQPPRTGQLPGIPITLAEALRGATTRGQQTDRTMGYWDLAAKVTQYYLVRRDAMELAALRQGVTRPGPQWQAKAQALQNDQELAQQSAEAAQMRFQQLCGRPTTAPPPLPADLPHCGKYETRYDEIFANRPEPAAQQLDDLLPLKYAELRNLAGLVAEASDWLQQVSKSRDPNSDGVGLLRAHDLLSLRRRALVEAVRGYNQDIAVYTELAAPNEVGTERLVAMLIRVSNRGGRRGPSGVQQASASEAASDADRATQAGGVDAEQANSSEPQPTYDSRTRMVRRPPFWRLRNREHSILVDRLRGRRANRN